jgi:glycine hydroxymethyltransferase
MTAKLKPGRISGGLRYFDPEIANLINNERKRQRSTLSLIASENYASHETLEPQGSIVSNKLASGYMGKRVCGGCQYVDRIEELAIQRAQKLFGADHVNVQAATASIANLAVYHALLNPGDKILAMRPGHGGHSTHGSPVHLSGRIYRFVFYELDPVTERLNYDTIRKLAQSHKPRMIIAGYNNYARAIDFSIFREIADKVGAYLMVDMAHFVGLVIAGIHPNPMPYADVITTSTHKTFKGPRGGGVILCRKAHSEKIDTALSPGLQAAPMMDVIAARAVLFKEAMSPQFKAYQHQIANNAKTLASALMAGGFELVSGGTDTHVMLVKLRDKGITGDVAEKVLESVGIIVNKSKIPFDRVESPQAGGIRVGTPAVTTRGMKEQEMKDTAAIMASVLKHPRDEKILQDAKREVRELARRFPLVSDEWEPQSN